MPSISLSLTLILALGVIAQWLSWRFRLPSILLLLLFGIWAGPISGLIDPDQIFHSLLFPIVSISVAIILFEGGLDLRFSELPEIGNSLRNLLTIGALITWVLSTLSAHYVLEMTWTLSILIGAILIVTGPTVIGPLLSHIRPTGKVAMILKWEGIVIDPIGALTAVIVFEAILKSRFQDALFGSFTGIITSVAIGLLFGLIAAGILILVIKKFWVPDFLQNALSLMILISAFTASNACQTESGLFAVTIMGIILANQRIVNLRRIVEFKETLRVLLISSLFIVLAARLRFSDLAQLEIWRSLFFLFLLLFVIRPLSVFASTIGSSLNWKEKVFISWMAPRGIVAAAVASILSYDLIKHGYQEAGQIVTVTFLVIIGTVSIYSLTAPWLARILKISDANPQGLLIVGAHKWAREIAKMLNEEGIFTSCLDSNYANISAAKMAGLEANIANVLEDRLDDIELQGIGKALALTQNDEVNSLAILRLKPIFGSAQCYQLSPKQGSNKKDETEGGELRGRFLFSSQATFSYLQNLFFAGATLKKTLLGQEFSYEDYLRNNPEEIPLFLITASKELLITTADESLSPKSGHTLISLLPRETEANPEIKA